MFNMKMGQVFFYPDIQDNLVMPESERMCVHYVTMSRSKHAQYSRAMQNPKQERAMFIEHVIRIDNLQINGKEIKTGAELYDDPHCPPTLISEISRAILGIIPPANIEDQEKNSAGPSVS